MEMVENWTREQFDDKVLRSGALAAVEFYSEGYPMCGNFGSCFEAAANRFSEKMLFGKVNVKREEALAEKYAVRSVPTMMVFCEGRGVCEIVGDADEDRICDVIDSAVERVEGGYREKDP